MTPFQNEIFGLYSLFSCFNLEHVCLMLGRDFYEQLDYSVLYDLN